MRDNDLLLLRDKLEEIKGMGWIKDPKKGSL